MTSPLLVVIRMIQRGLEKDVPYQICRTCWLIDEYVFNGRRDILKEIAIQIRTAAGIAHIAENMIGKR